MKRAVWLMPIDLNADGRVSFVAVHNHNLAHSPPQQPGNISDATSYMIRNIKPYRLPSPLVGFGAASSRSVRVGITARPLRLSSTREVAQPPIVILCRSLAFLPLLYQATNPATNQITGAPNTPVSIGPGVAQSFVFAFSPTAMAWTDVRFRFNCADGSLAPITSGLNTLLFSASATPVPDIVALAATPAMTAS